MLRPGEPLVRDDGREPREIHQHGVQRLLRTVRGRLPQAVRQMGRRRQPLQEHLPGLAREPDNHFLPGKVERLLPQELLPGQGFEVQRTGEMGLVLHLLFEHRQQEEIRPLRHPHRHHEDRGRLRLHSRIPFQGQRGDRRRPCRTGKAVRLAQGGQELEGRGEPGSEVTQALRLAGRPVPGGPARRPQAEIRLRGADPQVRGGARQVRPRQP